MTKAAVTKWCIYALKDPRTDEIRYVGWATNPRRRWLSHINDSKREGSWKAKWVCKMMREGITPVQEILEHGSGPNWMEAERRWIRQLRESGCRLTNATDGGDGSLGRKLSAESGAKISRANRGRKASAETRMRMSQSQRGKVMTDDARRKISAAHQGKVLSQETRLKIAERNRTRVLSDEAKARMFKGLAVGHAIKSRPPLPAETRDKIAETLRGRVFPHMKNRIVSEETRAKSSEAHKGYVMPAEQRLKIAAAVREARARPEVKAKISAAQKGRVLPMEQRLRMSATIRARTSPEERSERARERARLRWIKAGEKGSVA